MRTVSDYSMKRRVLVAQAQSAITEALVHFKDSHDDDLTVVEWIHVLNEAQGRFIAYLLKDEWQGEDDGGEA
jgi:hypothetical protein